MPLASLAPRLLVSLNSYLEYMAEHRADIMAELRQLLLEKTRVATPAIMIFVSFQTSLILRMTCLLCSPGAKRANVIELRSTSLLAGEMKWRRRRCVVMEERFNHGHFELTNEQVDAIRQVRPEVVVESEQAVVVFEATSDGPDILHWSAETPEALAHAISAMQRRIPRADGSPWKITLINEAGFANALLALGFRVLGHYLDHWLNDLATYQPSHEIPKVIREALDSETEQLAALSATCASDSGWLVNPSAWYREWMATPDSVVFVAERQGVLSGLCSARQYGRDKDKLWVRELAVHPQHRQQGHGRALLETSLRWGQARGSQRAFLAVDSRSIEAIGLYTRVGFEANGEEEFNLQMDS